MLRWAGDLLDQIDENAAEKVGVEDNAVVASEERYDSEQSLREVWEQTRQQLAQAREELAQRDGRYREDAKRRERAFHERLHERDVALSEAQDQLEQVREQRVALMRELELVKQRKDGDQTRVDELEGEVKQLQEQLENVLQERVQMQEEHQEKLRALHEQHRKREKELDEQLYVHSGALKQLHTREDGLVDTKRELVEALAASQKELQTVQLQHKALQQETRTLEARAERAQQQTKTLKTRFEQEKTAMETSLNEMQQTVAQTLKEKHLQGQQIEMLKTQLEEAQRAKSSRHERTMSEEDGYRKQREDLQTRVNSLTESLLSRQAEIERLNGECSTQRLELTATRSQVRTLETQLRQRQMEARLAENSYDLEQNRAPLSRRRRGAEARGRELAMKMGLPRNYQFVMVLQMMGVLDEAFHRLGVLMRAYPFVRMIFMVYIILLHLLVMFVLNHFLHHDSYMPTHMHPNAHLPAQPQPLS